MLDAALFRARSPKLFFSGALVYGAIDRKSSPLESGLGSLLTLRVSQINHCRFCVDIGVATLLQRRIGEDKRRALGDWHGSDLFSERERGSAWLLLPTP